MANLLRSSPGVLSALGVILGFIFIMSGVLPLAVVGAALIIGAFFVPYFRLAQQPSREWRRPVPERPGLNEQSSLPDIDTPPYGTARRADEPAQRAHRKAETRQQDEGSRSSAD
jgi:hypothetical protein